MASMLATSLHAAGCEIVDICATHYEHAAELAHTVGASAVHRASQLRPHADAVVLAVPDNAIASLCLPRHSWTVIHTAGSVPLDALSAKATNCGVMWPVCSISHHRQQHSATAPQAQGSPLANVPVCIEASNSEALATLHSIISLLGADAVEISSEQRLRLHVAAVIVNNFGNALHALTQEWLAKEGLSLELLAHLARQAAELNSDNLWQRQTGPAMRGDTATMQHHLQLLASTPDLQQLYSLMSNIIKTHGSPKSKA